MAGYSTGTISVTNGSGTVTGSGTNFTDNVRAGDLLRGPDGRMYEILSVGSATSLSIAPNYEGSTASGQSYRIVQTGSGIRDLASATAELVNEFSDVRDQAGAGFFGDGSASAPGVRFLADQDTGMFRAGSNIGALAAGGTGILYFLSTGVGIGQSTNTNSVRLAIAGSAGTADDLTLNSDATRSDIQTFNAKPLALNRQGNAIHMVSGGSGNVLIGTATGSGARLDVVGAVGAGTMSVKVGADGNNGIGFLNASGSSVGSIVVGASTTTYNTSSDYRLGWKAGHVPLEGSGEFIDALQPRYFPLIGQAGFIAHEFAEVSPSSVTGEKDAEDEGGNPIYQAMMAASPEVIANMVAELKSLRARVAALEAN